MARASRARRKSLYEPTAASERAPRDRKAPEIFTFTSSQVTSKIKHPGGRKRKVGNASKAVVVNGKGKSKGKLSNKVAPAPQGLPGKKVFHKELKSTGLEWEVKKIVDSKIDKKGERFYKVQWEHYPAKDSTWEPAINLYNCPQKISEFDAKFPNKP